MKYILNGPLLTAIAHQAVARSPLPAELERIQHYAKRVKELKLALISPYGEQPFLSHSAILQSFLSANAVLPCLQEVDFQVNTTAGSSIVPVLQTALELSPSHPSIKISFAEVFSSSLYAAEAAYLAKLVPLCQLELWLNSPGCKWETTLSQVDVPTFRGLESINVHSVIHPGSPYAAASGPTPLDTARHLSSFLSFLTSPGLKSLRASCDNFSFQSLRDLCTTISAFAQLQQCDFTVLPLYGNINHNAPLIPTDTLSPLTAVRNMHVLDLSQSPLDLDVAALDWMVPAWPSVTTLCLGQKHPRTPACISVQEVLTLVTSRLPQLHTLGIKILPHPMDSEPHAEGESPPVHPNLRHLDIGISSLDLSICTTMFPSVTQVHFSRIE